MKLALIFTCFVTFISAACAAQKASTHSRDSVLKRILSDPCYCSTPGAPCTSANSRNYYYTGHQYVSNYTMNRLLRRDLTKITLDEEGLPSLGNYATTKIGDDKASVAFNASLYNVFNKRDTTANVPMKNIITFNVKAGLNEGVSSLFTNSNVNNETSIKVKYTKLTKGTVYKNPSFPDCNQLKLVRERLLYEYEGLQVRFLVDSANFVRSFAKYEFRADSIRRRLAQLRNELVRIRSTIPINVDLIAQVSEMVDVTTLDSLEFQNRFNEFQAKKPTNDTLARVDSFYKRLLQLETSTVKWTEIKVQWWDFDAGFTGKKYNLFNKALPVDSQLSKKNFTQWSIGASFNNFSSSPTVALLKHGFFLKVSYLLSNDNSLTNADTKEISTAINIDTPNFRRQVLSKVNAYDVPFSKLFSHTFKFQFSDYLNEKRTNALSFYSTCLLTFQSLKRPFVFDDKPNITAGLGYSFGLLDKEKERNVINLEVFLNFQDLMNAAEDKDTRFYNRHQFGVKFGVPFNSIFLNQK